MAVVETLVLSVATMTASSPESSLPRCLAVLLFGW